MATGDTRLFNAATAAQQELKRAVDCIEALKGTDDFKEIERFEKAFNGLILMLRDANPQKWSAIIQTVNACGLAQATDSFLTVLEQHKIQPTEAMITKLLECASYQRWQEIKAEAWGKK